MGSRTSRNWPVSARPQTAARRGSLFRLPRGAHLTTMVRRPLGWMIAIPLAVAIAIAHSAMTRDDQPQRTTNAGAAQPAGSDPAQGTPWQRMTSKMRNAHLPASGQDALTSRFAPLRSRPERMSRAAQRSALNALGAPLGALELDRAQLVETKLGSIWLTAGNGLVCAFQARTFALSCDVFATVVKRGLFLGTVERPAAHASNRQRFLMIGLVPDGARRVRVQVGSRSPRWVAVHQNTVSAEAREPIIVQALR